MNNCRLDTLPVELVHHLLSYFSAHEIFYTFTNLTSYIDAVLAACTNYRVNFKAITRSNFDLVWEHIRPDQVIALTLSDDEDTPGLVDLFLSRFQINQFTRLQALKLIEIGADFWESIIIPMTTLKYLRSFCVSPLNQNHQWTCNLSAADVTQLDQLLFDSYASILPQISQLSLRHGEFLHSIQFPHLRHLALALSTIDLMKHISVAAPQLRSLSTCFSDDKLHTELIYPMAQLNGLILQIKGFQISMNVFERMMANLSRLKHLELTASCDNDVIDGQRWQTKVENLVTFNFKFYVPVALPLQQLESFRTSFWLEEKRWFVAHTFGCFFSVPHFTTKEVDNNFRVPLFTSIPDNGLFYECIDKLQLTKKPSHIHNHFPHVHTLTVYAALPLYTIKKIVQLRQIYNLVLPLLRRNFPVKSLINSMPNLCQISITSDVENFLQRIRYKALEKIRTLEIGNASWNDDNYNIEDLCTVFPNVRHLKVNDLCSTVQIFDFLDQFTQLSTASFFCISAYQSEETQQQIRVDIQSTLDQMPGVQGLNYAYRFDQSRIYFWI